MDVQLYLSDPLAPIDEEDRVIWQSSQYGIRHLLSQLDELPPPTPIRPLPQHSAATSSTHHPPPPALGSTSTAPESGRPSKRPRRPTRTQSQQSLSKLSATAGPSKPSRATAAVSAESAPPALHAVRKADGDEEGVIAPMRTDLLEDILAQVMAENERKAAATQRRSQSSAETKSGSSKTKGRTRTQDKSKGKEPERSAMSQAVAGATGGGVLADRTNLASPSVERTRSRSSSGSAPTTTKNELPPPHPPSPKKPDTHSRPPQPAQQSPRGSKRRYSLLNPPDPHPPRERVAFEADIRISMETGLGLRSSKPGGDDARSPPRTRARAAALAGTPPVVERPSILSRAIGAHRGPAPVLPPAAIPSRATTVPDPLHGVSASASQAVSGSQACYSASQGPKKRNAPLGMHAPRAKPLSSTDQPRTDAPQANLSKPKSISTTTGPDRTPGTARSARLASSSAFTALSRGPLGQSKPHKIPAFRPPAPAAPTQQPQQGGLIASQALLLTPARAGTVAANTRSASRRRSLLDSITTPVHSVTPGLPGSVADSVRSTRSGISIASGSGRSGRSARREPSSCDDSFGLEVDVGELEEVMKMYDA